MRSKCSRHRMDSAGRRSESCENKTQDPHETFRSLDESFDGTQSTSDDLSTSYSRSAFPFRCSNKPSSLTTPKFSLLSVQPSSIAPQIIQLLRLTAQPRTASARYSSVPTQRQRPSIPEDETCAIHEIPFDEDPPRFERVL